MTTVPPLIERTSAQYAAQIVDQAGAGVPAASLSTLTLTLYDFVSGAIINSRNGQNVLNANGVTIDASGNLVWTIDPLDNVILDDTKATEVHVALFKATWGTGKGLNHQVSLPVQNLARVP